MTIFNECLWRTGISDLRILNKTTEFLTNSWMCRFIRNESILFFKKHPHRSFRVLVQFELDLPKPLIKYFKKFFIFSIKSWDLKWAHCLVYFTWSSFFGYLNAFKKLKQIRKNTKALLYVRETQIKKVPTKCVCVCI